MNFNDPVRDNLTAEELEETRMILRAGWMSDLINAKVDVALFDPELIRVVPNVIPGWLCSFIVSECDKKADFGNGVEAFSYRGRNCWTEENILLDRIVPDFMPAIDQYMADLCKSQSHQDGFIYSWSVTHLKRYVYGSLKALHADASEIDGSFSERDKMILNGEKDGALNSITMKSGIISMNDGYQGGELYFPAGDLAVKVPAGSAVLFPPSNIYSHGVLPVTDGQRYTLPFFLPPDSLRKMNDYLIGLLT